MRLLLVFLIAVLLSIGGTLLLLRPEVHDLVTDWSEQVASAVRKTTGAAPQKGEPNARGLEETGPEAGQAAEHIVLNSIFWFNQGLSLFYTLLGAVISELVRSLSERRRKLEV